MSQLKLISNEALTWNKLSIYIYTEHTRQYNKHLVKLSLGFQIGITTCIYYRQRAGLLWSTNHKTNSSQILSYGSFDIDHTNSLFLNQRAHNRTMVHEHSWLVSVSTVHVLPPSENSQSTSCYVLIYKGNQDNFCFNLFTILYNMYILW